MTVLLLISIFAAIVARAAPAGGCQDQEHKSSFSASIPDSALYEAQTLYSYNAATTTKTEGIASCLTSSISTLLYSSPTLTSSYTTQSPTTYIATQVSASSTGSLLGTPTPAAASSSGLGDHIGDMTHYDPSVGTTSCGIKNLTTNDFVVAMNKPDMANGVNPNNNPKCNAWINIYSNGNVIKAKVVDTCPVCLSGDIDVTDALFYEVAPNGDGRIHGVSWSWV